MDKDVLNTDLIIKLVNKNLKVGDKESFLYKNQNNNIWNLTIIRDEDKYSPYLFAIKGKKEGTNETWNRRYTSIENAILHIVNDFNENGSKKDSYKDLDDYIKKEQDRNNCISGKGEEYRKKYKGYYKNYLDIPKNKIGEILEDGTVKKEFFQEGHIYKNICNFYRQDGICYISENQADKITRKSEAGEDYETYQTIYEKVKEAYQKEGIDEKKYKLKDFVETIFNDLTWQSVEALIIDSIDALDKENFLDVEEEI